MKFNLIDKIESLTDERIVAVKYVSLAEEYLADHFPTFPVLPGVMMLEAADAGGRVAAAPPAAISPSSMAVLKEARNVKYGNFVAPGNFLRVEVEFVKATETGATFKATGIVGDATGGGGRGSSWRISTWPTSSRRWPRSTPGCTSTTASGGR